MTFYIRDTREGIELYAISIAGLMIHLAAGTKLTAYELKRLSEQEGVYFNVPEQAV